MDSLRRTASAQVRRSGSLTAGLALAATVLVAACGATPSADRKPAPPPVTPVAAARSVEPSLSPARLLVFFKRVVGGDPIASQLTVDRDGRTAALVTLGGINGEKKHVFTLPARQLRTLGRLLAHARLHDTTCCNVNYYLYFVSFRGHTWRVQQGRVPRPMRRLIGTLNSILNTHTGFAG